MQMSNFIIGFDQKLHATGMQHMTQQWPPADRAHVRLNPANQNAWQKLGVSYANSGLFTEAVASFEQAIAIHSGGFAEIMANLAVVYQKMGQLELAESCLLDALAEEPENGRFLVLLGEVRVLLGK